jgi:RHS repeat-associated protein
VSYGYDQRGLLKSITYPDDKVVTYTRDALARIDSVTYDGKLLADYYYQGDTVIKKEMVNAEVEYAATVDVLGRITGETFSDISTSTSFMTNSYDYTSYSNRLDERNDIDYTFDGLGKLTAEDSTSYTSDILGNPTNASDDGLAYALDNEDRVTQVSDVSGTLGVYAYDRLGRRASKTVDGTTTHFVYDLSGNVIAEYEDDDWARDYIYGAKGEAVYMRFPQTTEMNDALANFVSFVEAWLCYPYCTQDDLQWDYDDSNDINLVDYAYAVDANDFTGAFTTNGRYLLTDFCNSVIGKVNLGGSVDEVSYDAWGLPSVSQGVDLEGLSVFWNGYYYDNETNNYYLRNRYYSPLERRFLTEDPHGINPDGNWNNSFRIERQYSDGYGLQVYCKGDPINNVDSWGLWNYALPPSQRTEDARTFVIANDAWEMRYNIRGLAQFLGLNEEEFDKWGERAINKVNGINKCGAWVPNTAYIDIGAYSWGALGWYLINYKNQLSSKWKSEGLSVVYTGKWETTKQSVLAHMGSQDVYKYAFIGHGYGNEDSMGELSSLLDDNHPEYGRYFDISPGKYTLYGIKEMQLIACNSDRGREDWISNISRAGFLRTVKGLLKALHREYEDVNNDDNLQ